MESNKNEPEVNGDEFILEQQRQIEKEMFYTIPLISELQSYVTLQYTLIDEYVDNEIYNSKVADLGDKYTSIRRTRPDGNCFFRAFAYAYLEYLVGNKEDYNKFRELAFKSKEKLVQLGFLQFTFEDFHKTFMDVINRVSPLGNIDEKQELHKILNQQGCSDYFVVYLRLITSGQLQEGADFYQNFIEGNVTIEEFRHQKVEPMNKECDHIHIIALCAALNVGVRVEYLDHGVGGKVVAHDFPEGTDSKVFLLYRPGHYDILYPK